MWIDEILPARIRLSPAERLYFVRSFLAFEKRIRTQFEACGDCDLDQCYWDRIELPDSLLTSGSRLFHYCAARALRWTVEGKLSPTEHTEFLSRLKTSILREFPLLFRKYRHEEIFITTSPLRKDEPDKEFLVFKADLERSIDLSYGEYLAEFLSTMAEGDPTGKQSALGEPTRNSANSGLNESANVTSEDPAMSSSAAGDNLHPSSNLLSRGAVTVNESKKGREFPKRAAWLAERLLERNWNKHRLAEYGGPHHKTTQRILNGCGVGGDVLGRVAKALSAVRGFPAVLMGQIPEE